MAKQKNYHSAPSGQDRDETREIIRRLIADDHNAWCALVDTYSGLLLGLARNAFERHGRHASRHDTEDAVTAVWRDLLANDKKLLHSCLERGEILPLLHTLVRNRSVDMMRKRGSDPLVPMDREKTPEVLVLPEVHQDEPPRDSEISLALESLPLKERSCIKLFFLQDRSYREIAELTGMPVNSIGPTIRRALDKLRKVFDKE
ncbi:MAG TPA: hypothetical protein DCZ94_14315 [Lentisphaeria bacterium]|nr:MAG: hypothetical protein A2X48_01720 [Lentisphaerae bacterium GWF2_49_21]HBC88121.1 hypothetical protein [Lentisphaeria bacterium]